MRFYLFFVVFAVFASSCEQVDKTEVSRPNIVYILADDLGYGEIGTNGQSIIKTPNIDRLADVGISFTNHYSGAPVCAPSRYVLMTGKHLGHSYVRGNDEWVERGDVWDYELACKDESFEGQLPIPLNTVSVGKILQENGYTTGIFGKWGLGAPGSDGVPNAQGFDSFYGYNCQRQAHNLYPPHLWENDVKVALNNSVVSPRTKLSEGADPFASESYSIFNQSDYAPTLIHNKAISFIKNNSKKPFFLYYASPLPHLPLQAPKEWVDKYREIIGDEDPYLGDKGYFPCRYPRATYAAMIAYLDYQVGDIIKTLKEQGVYDNTIIMFSSDNGPTYTGGVDFEYFESSKPFSNGYGRTKGFTYEGGVRVPFIVSWGEKIKQKSSSKHVSAFYDFLPTVCDLLNVSPPDSVDGISFLPTLTGDKQKQHYFIFWDYPEYGGQQAVRLGKWKGIRKNINDGNLLIELYDIESDTLELHDVGKNHPEIVKKIQEIMKNEHVRAQNPNFWMKNLGDGA